MIGFFLANNTFHEFYQAVFVYNRAYVGTVGEGRGYDELLPDTTELELGQGLRVRALGLAALIALKEATGRDKDRAVLPVLRRTLEEKGRG